MAKYVSEETGETVEIECRFCRMFDETHTAATHLAGQWGGGDIDEDPRWVPVCPEHLADWFRDDDTDHTIPEASRLPVLELPT